MEVVMKKNLLLSFLLFGSIHQAKSMQFLKDIIRNSTIENTARNPTLKNLLFNAGLWYCTSIACNIGHELGHVLATKLLFNKTAYPHISPLPWKGGYTTQSFYMPEGKRNALVCIAGPICGIATAYALLKGNTIANLYLQGSPLTQALSEGLKQSAFNFDINCGLAYGALISTCMDILTLIPYKIENDGFQAFRTLWVISKNNSSS